MNGETTKIDLSNRLYYLLFALIVGGLLWAATGLGLVYFDDTDQEQITISGEGIAYVKPDVAVISLGVKTEGKKSDEVVSQNNEKMNAIIQSIKDLGIEDKDIKTSLYNLQPKYNYTQTRGQELVGYSLNQQITVKVRDFEKISSVLDKSTSNGANTIGQLQITVDDPESAKAEAREKAIEAAKTKAEAMAKNSGMKLGKIINIYEDYNNYPQPMYDTNMVMAEKAVSSITPPTIEAGEEEISVTVFLTYKVK